MKVKPQHFVTAVIIELIFGLYIMFKLVLWWLVCCSMIELFFKISNAKG